MKKIAYRSRNVREILVELKNISELAVDLAYAAALYGYPGLAEEVLELERRADSLQYPAKITLMLAAKRASEAERLVGIVQIVDAAVSITNAAADIAAIVTDDIGVPEELRATLPEADEVLVRATVSEDSDDVGRSLGDLTFETEAGVSVVAIRRGDEWNSSPDTDAVIHAGDIVIGRGPREGVKAIRTRLTGEDLISRPTVRPDVEELEQATELVMELKDISELAVGLSYAAVLFDDDGLAAEVFELEERSDTIQNDIERLVIEAGDRVAAPARLRGLLHLATASEAICDAAVSIADIVLREGSVHPVFGQAIGESDEIITTVTVAAGSRLAERTLGGIELEEQTGMSVMAVDRDTDWILGPTGETRLKAGDVLISRGPGESLETLRAWAGN